MEAGLLADFNDADALLLALQGLRARGYRALDAYTPYPLHRVDEILELPRSRLPLLVFPFGAFGCAFALFIQWYCNAYSYRLNVGGRPPAAILAFIPITFETTVLFSAFAALSLLFWIIGLPRLSHPVFDVPGFERVTVDRFFLAVDRRDPGFETQRTRQDLMQLGALSVSPFGDAP